VPLPFSALSDLEPFGVGIPAVHQTSRRVCEVLCSSSHALTGFTSRENSRVMTTPAQPDQSMQIDQSDADFRLQKCSECNIPEYSVRHVRKP
jgi:hypothetical protein